MPYGHEGNRRSGVALAKQSTVHCSVPQQGYCAAAMDTAQASAALAMQLF